MKKYFILTLAVCLGSVSSPVSACTGLVANDRERVLVGNNEDWFNPRTKIWFIQPLNDRYGSVFFGFDNYWPQGGMNQKGLFFDAFALEPKEVDGQEGKPRFKGNLIKEVMSTCATVKEALALLDKYSLHFMTRFQMFIADASGDSAIIEGNAIIRKEENYQVVTNFRQSETDSSETSCWRYRVANDMLMNCREDKLHCIRSILEATHQKGDYPTLYSNIYDLKAKRVYVYYFHNFQEEVVIDLENELIKKPGVLDLPDLFSPNLAAQAYVAQFTNLKKEYTHNAPIFVVRYPEAYDEDKTLDPNQVFLAKSRFGQVPVLTVSVAPAEANMTLSRVGGEYYAPRLRQFGKQVQIISNHPAKLADGSEVYETKIVWRYQGKTKINSLVLSAFKEDKLINVALHHTGELDYLKHIPYSLSY